MEKDNEYVNFIKAAKAKEYIEEYNKKKEKLITIFINKIINKMNNTVSDNVSIGMSDFRLIVETKEAINSIDKEYMMDDVFNYQTYVSVSDIIKNIIISNGYYLNELKIEKPNENIDDNYLLNISWKISDLNTDDNLKEEKVSTDNYHQINNIVGNGKKRD